MCKILRDAYDINDETILRARRRNIIPKEGILSDGYEFSFHGGGCYFKFDGGSIDVDFGPNDRCDGFDAQRLYEFLKSLQNNGQNEKVIKSSAMINEGFALLLKDKIIKKPSWYPNPHLYYLEDNITDDKSE